MRTKRIEVGTVEQAHALASFNIQHECRVNRLGHVAVVCTPRAIWPHRGELALPRRGIGLAARCSIHLYYTDLNEAPAEAYRCVYADCPWTYKDKALAGRRGAGCKYPLMSLAELRDLPVSRISARDAICFMWVTKPLLQAGLDTMRAWGFTYKTNGFTWIKTTKNGKLFWGMGRWTRANPEDVLIGTRGKPRRISAGVHSVIMAPVGPHSRKPPEARDRIVELIGDVPRIELFARGETEGWDGYGNDREYTEGKNTTLSTRI